MLALVACAVVGCSGKGESNARESNRDTQESMMDRAQAAIPAYEANYFLTRESVNEWMKRTDVPDKLWYIYVMADNGQFIGYYISRTIPVSINISMTAPDVKIHGTDGNVVMKAPALDGVYYGGSMDQYYFFDAATDAMGVLTNLKFIYFDQPLKVDAPLLQIKNYVNTIN